MLIKVACESKEQAMEKAITNIISIPTKPAAGNPVEGVAMDHHTHTKDQPGQLHSNLHFDKPIEKLKMEAIKVLIEEGTKKQKKGPIQKRAAVMPMLDA